MIERLYEEVLEEGAIMDWFKDPENKPILKQLATQLTVMFGWPTSAITMGHYVSDFLMKNFPNLGPDIIKKIAQFVANNPQILDLIK
jgi:hypothetical protein